MADGFEKVQSVVVEKDLHVFVVFLLEGDVLVHCLYYSLDRRISINILLCVGVSNFRVRFLVLVFTEFLGVESGWDLVCSVWEH